MTRSCRHGCFNPRAHEGRDFLRHPAPVVDVGFNPRAHEGRDQKRLHGRCPDKGFNPRAHEGRDCIYLLKCLHIWVSTHAPTRGATQGIIVLIPSPKFQPTRPRGARRSSPLSCAICASFNPRAHEGRDFVIITLATDKRFQPTRPRGARPKILTSHQPHGLFQPTRPRGARRIYLLKCLHIWVSTHAPTRGATPLCAQTRAQTLFQPTRPRGARPIISVTLQRVCGFNPRAHEGRDKLVVTSDGATHVSTHAPTRGATHR